MKTMDAGELEAHIAFKAGAELGISLGQCRQFDHTRQGAVKTDLAHGKGIVVDIIGVSNKVSRAKEARALGAKLVEFRAWP